MNKHAQTYISAQWQGKPLIRLVKQAIGLVPNDVGLVLILLLVLAIYSSVYGHPVFVIWDMGLVLQQVLLLLWLPYNLWRIHRLRHQVEHVCCCQDRRKIALRRAFLSMRVRLLVASLVAILLGTQGVYLCSLSLPLQVSTCWLFAIFALGMVSLEIGFMCWMLSRLQEEYWVQVVDNQGNCVGTVPHSRIAEVRGGRLSQVRLIAISHELIYLEKRTPAQGEAQVYDTPLVSWQTEGVSTLETAQDMIDARFCGIRRVYPRELLHYRGYQGTLPLYNHLYVVYIAEPSQLQIDCRPIEGKWWSLDQLREQMQMNPKEFALALHAEMPLLEETVLLVQKLN